MPSLEDIKSDADFQAALKSSPAVLAYFWAAWSHPCEHMGTVVEELANEFAGRLVAVRVEAEAVDQVTERCQVLAVPCFVLFKDGAELARVEGADPPRLAAAVSDLVQASGAGEARQPAARGAPAGKAARDVPAEIQALLSRHRVVLFMKGSQDAPRCGFSGRVVEALRDAGCRHFQTVDILQDEELRAELKRFSNWPTYPQLYVAGDLVGGCDIVEEMAASGELQQLVAQQPAGAAATAPAAGPPSTPAAASAQGSAPPSQPLGGSTALEAAAVPPLGAASEEERIKGLLAQHPTLLFMKGSPAAPRCGFSRRTVEALRGQGISFAYYDILGDSGLREALKVHSKWPTYPQLYVAGELLGGSDIVEQMAAGGELKSSVDEMLARLPGGDGAGKRAALEALVRRAPVMLFMKGSPDAPRCGFSRRVVEALTAQDIVFESFDILQDEDVRQGLKELSNWPTYPQLYVAGELMGGCDIVEQMAANGELKQAVNEMEHRTTAPV